MNIKNFVLRIFFVLAFMFGSMGMLPSNARQANAAAEKLMQYAAAGHILGFGADKVVLAGLDHALTVSFVSGSGSEPVATEAGPGGERGAPPLGKVTYPQVWPGVDVVYSTSEGNITESTYVLSAGAGVADVRLKYNVPVKVLSDGGLSFSFGNGEMTESAPVAWQEVNGQRVAVDVRFEKLGAKEVGFVLGAHDPVYGVTIDPTYAWHTFYGSNDEAWGIALDINDNVYVTGRSGGSWNGPNNEQPLNEFTNVIDGMSFFVLKLDKNGEYQWHTFYDANNVYPYPSITVLGNGIYIAGIAGASWNGPSGQSPLHGHAGGADIFVLKLDANGAYQWHTFYGSAAEDEAAGISVALENIFTGTVRIYVVGNSAAAWLGDNGQSPLHPFNGALGEIVVLRLNGDGTYLWHTFYGSTGLEDGCDIKVYSSSLYIAGTSNNTWNGDGNTEPLHKFSGSSDFTLLKLNTFGAYQWHTFYGSPNSDAPTDVDVDATGVYAVGNSFGSWVGPSGQLPLDPYQSGMDMAVLKLDSNGTYQWHAFYGGAGDDYASGIDLHSGTVNISGNSTAAWTGPSGQAPTDPYASASDITNIRLDTAGNYLWHTFYGGNSPDWGFAVAVDELGNIYTAGQSQEAWNGTGGTSPKHLYGSGLDLVVIKTSPTPVFVDVPPAYWAASSIETLYASGVTGGCVPSPLAYCPAKAVTRAQMAVFLVRAKHGLNFVPPTATGMFPDVPVGSFAANYIEQLAADGITSGCGGGNFCPNKEVTRAQMAIFLVKAKHGAAFVPPTATGIFPDVPVGSFGADYIEQLAADGVTSGCGGGKFCPSTVVKRDSMAVFLVKNFTLP